MHTVCLLAAFSLFGQHHSSDWQLRASVLVAMAGMQAPAIQAPAQPKEHGPCDCGNPDCKCTGPVCNGDCHTSLTTVLQTPTGPVNIELCKAMSPCENGTCPTRRPSCGPGGCKAPTASKSQGCGACGGSGGYPGKHAVVRPAAGVYRFFNEHRPVRRAIRGAGRFLWRCRPGFIFRR